MSHFFFFFGLKWVENESFFYIFHEHLIWSFLGNVSTTKANKTFSMFLISMGLFWLWSWNCKVLNGNFVLFYLKSYSTLLYKLFGLNEDFFFFFFFEKEMKKFRGCFTKVCRFLWEARIVMYFFGENEQMPFFLKKNI